MGLSSQQSSVSGIDWSQTGLLSGSGEIEIPKPERRNQPQRAQIWPPLRCPRCDSTNTKFCYYNNYNRSQPRYLCKACRRHWTDGGSLRNVPVGGGRKNKRNKTTAAKTATCTATATTTAAAATDAITGSAVNNSSVVPRLLISSDPTTTIFPEILCHVLHPLPPPLLPPPVASADYSIMSNLMGLLQSHQQIGNITAKPSATVSSYGSTRAPVSFSEYSGQGPSAMSSALSAWRVAPHVQPPPPVMSSGGGEASASTATNGYWMSGWPDEEVPGLGVPELGLPPSGDEFF